MLWYDSCACSHHLLCRLPVAIAGKKGVGIPSVLMHEGEGLIVTIGTALCTLGVCLHLSLCECGDVNVGCQLNRRELGVGPPTCPVCTCLLNTRAEVGRRCSWDDGGK